jgi:mono/diheme cytochrome c family protein
MNNVLMLVLLVTAMRVAAVQEDAAQAPLRSGDAARGQAAFMNAGCYPCHGTGGQGGAGARLAPKPLAQAAFAAYVRSGRRGWSVAGGMPAYPPRVLSDAALADIYAYLASIPAPQPAAENPLFKD